MSPPISPETIIVRALRHQETSLPTSTPCSLDLLGQAIATQFRCSYLPSLLSKTHPTRQNKGLSVDDRNSELEGIYTFTSAVPITATSPFLLIDDLLTTGATARAILDALRQKFPSCSIRIFTLAKVGYTVAPTHQYPLMGNTYRLEKETGWKQSC
jgi:predicted amidophosphoribosyltransferase